MFIIKGGIAICEPIGRQEPFTIFPTNSVFGDYEALRDQASFLSIKAVSKDYTLSKVEHRGRSQTFATMKSEVWVVRKDNIPIRQKDDDQEVVIMCCSKFKFMELCKIFTESQRIIKQRAFNKHKTYMQNRKEQVHIKKKVNKVTKEVSTEKPEPEKGPSPISHFLKQIKEK